MTTANRRKRHERGIVARIAAWEDDGGSLAAPAAHAIDEARHSHAHNLPASAPAKHYSFTKRTTTS